MGVSGESFPGTVQVPQGKSSLEHLRSGEEASVVGAQRARFRIRGAGGRGQVGVAGQIWKGLCTTVRIWLLL